MLKNISITKFSTLVNLGFQKFDKYWLIIIENFSDFKFELFDAETTKVLW